MADADGDVPQPLSIGVMIGGPGALTHKWKDEAHRLRERVHEMAPAVAPFNLNVVFQIPGSVWAPDFAGVRTATFDKSAPELMVQAAVPSLDVNREEMQIVLLDLLDRAVQAAVTFASRRRLPPSLLQVQQQILAALRPPTS